MKIERNRGDALQSSGENDTHAQNIVHTLRPNPMLKPKTELEQNDPKWKNKWFSTINILLSGLCVPLASSLALEILAHR